MIRWGDSTPGDRGQDADRDVAHAKRCARPFQDGQEVAGGDRGCHRRMNGDREAWSRKRRSSLQSVGCGGGRRPSDASSQKWPGASACSALRKCQRSTSRPAPAQVVMLEARRKAGGADRLPAAAVGPPRVDNQPRTVSNRRHARRLYDGYAAAGRPMPLAMGAIYFLKARSFRFARHHADPDCWRDRIVPGSTPMFAPSPPCGGVLGYAIGHCL